MYLDSVWLHGTGLPEAGNRKVSWGGGSLNVTNRTRHTDIEARSLILPKTQGGYKKPHTCPKIQLGVEKAGLEPQSRTLRKSTRCAVTMMIKILPTL